MCRLAWASHDACKASAFGLCRFNSCSAHSLARSASGEAAGPSSRPEGIETPTGYCELGVSSNGKTAGLQPANEGSTPSTVH